MNNSAETASGAFLLSSEEILLDYRQGYRSRQVSVLGKREVLAGKAKFGIFGDGKELPQLAMARAFRKGDWRSGYYRDQTLLFALSVLTPRQFFAQLYADPDVEHEPQSGGRQMNAHFATRLLDSEGRWFDQTDKYNSSADVSPTAAQMPRTVGLAYASVLYRRLADQGLDGTGFSRNGGEVAWATIGNASAAEGHFWESVNAIGVLGAPAVIVVYDDGYGISVPNQFQMVKENVSAALEGFRRVSCPADQCDRGFDLYTVPAWDYPALLSAFTQAGENARASHIPALVHVTEGTQPLGHSTSGSQERYKTPERLAWEREFDCMAKFRIWILERGIVGEERLEVLEKEDRDGVEAARSEAYEASRIEPRANRDRAVALLSAATLREEADALAAQEDPTRRDVAAALHRGLTATRGEDSSPRRELADYLATLRGKNKARYGRQLYAEGAGSALRVPTLPPRYSASSPEVMGFDLINTAFDAALARDARVIAFGEDLGNLGDVNQGFQGLQEKYGPYRVSDTGIREATIVGQAIGMALRGLRPIAEIQYLDYLLYALQLLSDDLATLRWRTAGGQVAPAIIRTRGHRLEGVWHSGSPMGGILNLVRGMYVLVPRDFTRAAAFYNTMLKADEPAIIVEVLNGYRRRERLPDNLADITLTPGIPEVLRKGKDLTLLSYGACVRIAAEAVDALSAVGADVELIDAQSLLPFDTDGVVIESLRKTSRLLIVDEDVPGGAGAYLLQEILDRRDGYELLDSPPRVLSAAEHRPAYGSDGDYWSKPNRETVFDAAYDLLREAYPARFPAM